jgi:hypothetical protein
MVHERHAFAKQSIYIYIRTDRRLECFCGDTCCSAGGQDRHFDRFGKVSPEYLVLVQTCWRLLYTSVAGDNDGTTTSKITRVPR